MSGPETSVAPDDLVDEWIVRDLETLKLMANPLRAQILQELIARPLSVKQIAAALHEPVTKLYRHVDLMQQHGIIRVVGQVLVSGILESHYRARARTFVLDRALFPSGKQDAGLEAILDFVLDGARSDIKRAVRAGAIDLQAKAPEPRSMLARRLALRLTPTQAHLLSERLCAMLRELSAIAPGDEPEPTHYYALTVVLHETAEAPDGQEP